MKKKGFSITEILVAITILSFLAAGFFTLTVSARNLIWRSKRRLQGFEFAKRQIEYLRQFVNANSWNTSLSATSWTGNNTSDPNFKWRYRVDNVPAGAGNYNCRSVTVQVFWNESNI
jgi:prepilin-type N-terminal cleavage/methylation domain-containing protein